MAIKRKNDDRVNKFDNVVAELDRTEEVETGRSEKVVKTIAGKTPGTKIIFDKNGRTREVKIKEQRKTMPVYIPESLYNQFDAITKSYGISNNAAICQLIREYVSDKKSILE